MRIYLTVGPGLLFISMLGAAPGFSQPLDPPTPIPSDPKFVESDCSKLLRAGGVHIDLKAVATTPNSVRLTWEGFPGLYDVVTTGKGVGFHESITLSNPNPAGKPRPVKGTLTHAAATSNYQYHYEITATLTNGRKACGQASGKTPPVAGIGKIGGTVERVRTVPTPPDRLSGWVDLHTHPMSNLAFGGKVFHGGIDKGSLLPAFQKPSDSTCVYDWPAMSMEEALSDDAPTHGNPTQSPLCGDAIRWALIAGMEVGKGLPPPGHRLGSPIFNAWPRWNDIAHQKMWWEWIHRAYRGGLRVMVALSHNSRMLGTIAQGDALKACITAPLTCAADDKASSDLQIGEIKKFVLRHPEFMEVALSASDVYRIVKGNPSNDPPIPSKIAVVLGVEIDNIGNFNLPPVPPFPLGIASRIPPLPLVGTAPIPNDVIEGEIQRLYQNGVRYIFPIHLTDNAFGGTAVQNQTLFNVANLYETGHYWDVECSVPGDQINFISSIFTIPYPLNIVFAPGIPVPLSPECSPPSPGERTGNRNSRGLTQNGRTAIKAMMKRGMIIDIDHMSDRSAEETLGIAAGIMPGGGYPLVSGHSGIRDTTSPGPHTERERTLDQLERIGCLQGMFGVGTEEADAYEWAKTYAIAFASMSKAGTALSKCPGKVSVGGPGSAALGTDTNTLSASPRPPTMGPGYLMPGVSTRRTVHYDSKFPKSGYPTLLPPSAQLKQWDYNTEGVAHYGMYSDFLVDVRTYPPDGGLGVIRDGADLVDNHLMRSADYFWRMWQKIEAQKVNVH